MRNYPRNSPQAAARLLALTIIADGNVCRAELDAVGPGGAEAALGLPPGGFAQVLQTLCEDLLCGGPSGAAPASCVDDELLEALIDDVDDPALQRQVLAAVAAAVAADGHLSEAEQHVLAALRRRWCARPDEAPAGASSWAAGRGQDARHERMVQPAA